MTLDDILLEAEEKMIKTEQVVVNEFAGVRTGKASPALVENIQAEVYGSMMRIRERFLREIERKGIEYVVGGMRQILVDGERNARTRLREINDGVFRSILFNDDHGTFFGLTRVPLTIIKEGEELAVVVQGVSPSMEEAAQTLRASRWRVATPSSRNMRTSNG